MKPRDLAIVAAVVALGGLAAFDALRGGDDGRSARPASTPTTTRERPAEAAGDDIASPRGRLVFTGDHCSVREVDLADGSIADRFADASCGLWGPPRTGRVAYGVNGFEGQIINFRISDLDVPDANYGEHRAQPGSIVWAPDGSRVAWCDERLRGWELAISDEPTRLRRCAAGYLPNGAAAFIRGRDIVAADGTWLATAPGPIVLASFGTDGSLAVLVGRQILRYERVGDGEPAARVPVRDAFHDAPLFAPDNCAALLRSPHLGEPPSVTLISLGCPRRVDRRVIPGHNAAWSPDGAWFAVAASPPAISFHTPAGATAPLVVSAHANQLVWKEAR